MSHYEVNAEIRGMDFFYKKRVVIYVDEHTEDIHMKAKDRISKEMCMSKSLIHITEVNKKVK